MWSKPNFRVCIVRQQDRLLHSPSQVPIGLSVGHETWFPFSWHRACVIGWSKYILGLPSAPLHYGLTWPVGLPTGFQTPVSPFEQPWRQAGLCKWTVKESSQQSCTWRMSVSLGLFLIGPVGTTLLITLQTPSSNAFYPMNNYAFWFNFDRNLFLRFQLTISQNWLR